MAMCKCLQGQLEQGSIKIILVVLVYGWPDRQPLWGPTQLHSVYSFVEECVNRRSANTGLSISRAVYIHPKQIFCYVNSVITSFFLYLFIYLLIYLLIYLFIIIFIYLFIWFIYLFVCLFIYLFIYYIYLFIYLFIWFI